MVVMLSMQAAVAPACSSVDRAALLGFKARILKDTTGILDSWTTRDCCDGNWVGIQCNPATGRVTQMQLQGSSDKESGLYMKGTLSPTLGNLQFSEVLMITGMKRISGSIPESFANLRRLTQLALEDNEIHGTIPAGLGRMALLKAISLNGNHLTGQIPGSLGNIRNLVQLTLARNTLSGPVPSTFRNFHNLQYLDLSYSILIYFTVTESLVGDLSAWGLPASSNKNVYAKWSKKYNLKIRDSLLFLYPPSEDSVLQVTEEAYNSCNIADPILYMNNCNSVFNITSLDNYYFTSGQKGHCEKYQKLKISMLSSNTSSSAPALPYGPAASPSYENVFGSIPAPPSSSSSIKVPVFLSVVIGLLIYVH